ncbi:hypothetical protein CHS0354_007146 [Potamilus streckersoni]|uniref:Uncharacterized protein n=1 Tax=Potamilus streckersoni TaxID=2493646 RepID=A0AAE0VXG0_9BIVA|nr:hypothetical protein CHS0354_007146 [Potamilus streckersoni]
MKRKNLEIEVIKMNSGDTKKRKKEYQEKQRYISEEKTQTVAHIHQIVSSDIGQDNQKDTQDSAPAEKEENQLRLDGLKG